MKLKKISAIFSLFAVAGLVLLSFQNCGKSVYGQAEEDEEVLEEPSEEPPITETPAHSLSSLSLKDQSSGLEADRSNLGVNKTYTLSLPTQAHTDGATLFYDVAPATTSSCMVARIANNNVAYSVKCSTAGQLLLRLHLQQPKAADSSSNLTLIIK